MALREPDARGAHCELFCGRLFRQHSLYIGMRPSDDMNAGQLAFDGFDSLGASISSRLDSSDITDDDRRYKRVADLGHGANEFDIRGFEHGIGALDKGNQSAGFKESNSLRHRFDWLFFC
jgi:hypothetical protein